jgi:hypothetical protein
MKYYVNSVFEITFVNCILQLQSNHKFGFEATIEDCNSLTHITKVAY